MKVLHINTNYLHTPLHSELISGLEARGIHNCILMPRKKNDNQHLAKNLKPHQAKVIHKQILDIKDRFLYFYKQRKISNWISSENVDTDEYDILHAHTLYSDGYVAYKSNKPYVITVRNTDVNYFIKYYKHLKKIGMKILINAKAIIFLSEVYKITTINKLFKKEEDRKTILEKSYVLPNGINDFWIENQNNIKKNLNDSVNFLFVGRVMKNKNIKYTAEQLNVMFKQDNVTFHIVGPVIDRRYFKEIMSIPNVKYHGELNKSDILSLMKSMDVFIMISHKETFGLVYLEALTQNLPLLYTSNQGFDGYFREGEVGYSIRIDDKSDFKKKAYSILRNYDSVQENIINIEKSSFTWDSNIEKHIDIYNNVDRIS